LNDNGLRDAARTSAGTIAGVLPALAAARRNLSNNINGIPRSLRRARIGRTIVIFACGIAVYGRRVNPGRRHSREELNAPGDFLLLHAAAPCC